MSAPALPSSLLLGHLLGLWERPLPLQIRASHTLRAQGFGDCDFPRLSPLHAAWIWQELKTGRYCYK